MALLLVHMKFIRHAQLILRLVNINIVGVSTWNYTLVVTPEIHIMLVACYVLVHEIYMIIYAYEIDQIHVIVYLVSIYIVLNTHEMGKLYTACCRLLAGNGVTNA